MDNRKNRGLISGQGGDVTLPADPLCDLSTIPTDGYGGVKQPEHETNHSPPACIQIKKHRR